MTFVIETGIDAKPRAVDFVADWLRDMCPPHYSDAQIVQAYAHHLIGDMRRPAKMETVRKHLGMNWRFIGHLADESPGLFDEIWTEYVERILSQ
jgi:hypothetical protein